jgi:hypothetical protein
MTDRRLWLAGLGLLSLALTGRLGADQPAPDGCKKSQAAGAVLDAPALAARIDQLIAARWAEKGAKPAEPVGDAQFLRRVYLDLAGRIPRVAEVRDFLADRTPDKRQRLVEHLLDSPHYVQHFSNTWRDLVLPQNNNQQAQFFAAGFQDWLVTQFRDNVPYDQMVRAMLTVNTPADPRLRQAALQGVPGATPTPVAFMQVNELKPENLAAATSRLFLGVRLECAQCHDHPFASWQRKQFWEFAAFYAGLQRPIPIRGAQPAVRESPDRRHLKIPNTEKVVFTRFLDGTVPDWKEGMNTRATLADWVTSPANPFFARTTANRLWAHFFGIGLADPVDDEPTDDNPPSHPELLDELARQLAAHRFDLKYLIRAITASKTYQLSSVTTDPSQDELRLFARAALKGMSPEQLFESLAQATGFVEGPRVNNRFVAVGGPNNPRGEILSKFASQEKRTEFQTSILQALSLMNGKFVADATSLERSTTLAAVADAPFLDNAGRIEALFLAALSRPPRPEEAARFLNYVNAGGARNNPRAALGDVFWVLLNSPEFLLNH